MSGKNQRFTVLEASQHWSPGKSVFGALPSVSGCPPDEQAKIRERMAEVGICNLSTYMRKMALNGYVLDVDLAPVKEIVSLQRRCKRIRPQERQRRGRR